MCRPKRTGRSNPAGSDIRLPPSLASLVRGLKAGRGRISQRSLLTDAGVRPDLTPIVVTISPEDGLSRFLTALGTLFALREDASGEHIVTLSFPLERGALTSLVSTSASGGSSDEIGFEISIPLLGLAATLPSISSKRPTTGISGAACDHCGKPFYREDSYVQFVEPPHGMHLYHHSCFNQIMSPMI